ncbi:N-acetyltransferase [Actinomadura soli]|uniref:N-acetyltransferase n=1 Tax=Actinomadura soli TaxID=2508997 RepID=A0A5C4JK76_9ACTN|nr:N-acetyltransferase [Actinomadura soli]TMR07004.1 N-acetyltransferase [Actinomadura soli]
MDLLVVTVAQRPDLADSVNEFDDWPAFINQDKVGDLYYADAITAFPEFVQLAFDRAAPDRLVAKAFSVPFSWAHDPDERLPAGAWDEVILAATHDRLAGRKGNLVSALEISIRRDLRGTGLAAVMLAEMRGNAMRLGYSSLVAPVRPNAKFHQPDMPIEQYAALSRDDGLPVDPWLRTHVRAGGRIVGFSRHAMTISGELAEWRSWTGLPFDTAGPVYVPDALVPVHCDLVHDYAVYCEPCVWVHHPLN